MSDVADFICRATQAGCQPQLSGDWVVWTPPLPAELLFESMQLADEIYSVILATQQLS